MRPPQSFHIMVTDINHHVRDLLIRELEMDGYTVFSQGTNVLQPGDDLLQLAIDYVSANSPVGPVVEGRIIGP